MEWPCDGTALGRVNRVRGQVWIRAVGTRDDAEVQAALGNPVQRCALRLPGHPSHEHCARPSVPASRVATSRVMTGNVTISSLSTSTSLPSKHLSGRAHAKPRCIRLVPQPGWQTHVSQVQGQMKRHRPCRVAEIIDPVIEAGLKTLALRRLPQAGDPQPRRQNLPVFLALPSKSQYISLSLVNGCALLPCTPRIEGCRSRLRLPAAASVIVFSAK